MNTFKQFGISVDVVQRNSICSFPLGLSKLPKLNFNLLPYLRVRDAIRGRFSRAKRHAEIQSWIRVCMRFQKILAQFIG